MIFADTNPYTSIEGLLYASIIFFAFAAMAGAFVLSRLAKEGQTPKRIVYLHGALAITAFLMLIAFSVKKSDLATVETPYPLVSIILFALAAAGGLFLFTRDMMGKPGPVAVAFIHASIAAIALISLVVFAISNA